jgi:hypothetical protein
MNLKTRLQSLQKYLPLFLLLITIVSWGLIYSYTHPVESTQLFSWFGNNPVGLGILGLGLAGLLVYGLRNYFSNGIASVSTPSIRVMVSGGKTILIPLTEKKYPGESYWSGAATEDGGEIHQLVICQKANSTSVIDNQVTRSLLVTSSSQFVAEQFNELVRQHKLWSAGF